jgi:hypothetical protein
MADETREWTSTNECAKADGSQPAEPIRDNGLCGADPSSASAARGSGIQVRREDLLQLLVINGLCEVRRKADRKGRARSSGAPYPVIAIKQGHDEPYCVRRRRATS